MSATATHARLRIGELARRAGVTTRTIRYYEERGLLDGDQQRPKGVQRLYSDADLTRLLGLIRLRDLLGLSLEELVGLVEADEARAGLREELAREQSDSERARLLGEAIPLVERQLELVRSRQQRLAEFADELTEKLEALHLRRAELDAPAAR